MWKMKKNLESDVSNLMGAMRGGSALIVAFAHAFQIFCLPFFGLYGFPHLFTSWLATYAVVIFFIVSGFMIFFSVSNHTEADGFKMGKFFKARLFRIYPPLVASLLVCIVIFLFMSFFDIHGSETFRLGGELFVSREKVEIEWERILSTLLLLYNVIPGSSPPLSINGPLWTLSYEWWFYLFVMFAVNVSGGTWRRWLPLVIVFIFFCVAPSGLLLWVFFFIWCSGYLLGYLCARGVLFERRVFYILLLLVMICLSVIVAIGREKTLIYLGEPLQRYGERSHIIMLFFAFTLTIMIGFMIRSRLQTKILTRTAGYSYTLYLIHFPMQLLAFGLLHQYLHQGSWLISLAAGVVITLLVVTVAAKLARVVENRELIYRMLQRIKQ